MSFVPPTFGNLGKKVADLFKKKFDYANTVTVKHATTAGLTLESTGSVAQSDDKTSYLNSGTQKVVYKQVGSEFEGTLKTAGLAEGVAKFTKLYSGLTVTLKGGNDEKPIDKKNKGELYASAEAEYAQDFFSLSLLVKHAQSHNSAVTATGVIGVDGLSVGARMQSEGSQCDVKTFKASYDVGIEYSKNEFTGSLTTDKNLDVIKFGLWTAPTKSYQVGAEYSFDASVATAAPVKTLTVGTEYSLDADTVLKAKFNTAGDIHTVVQHKLAKPQVQIALASNFQLDANNKAQTLKGKNFGLALTFGDL